jgi:GNAT superfamily N-acetyltransferase
VDVELAQINIGTMVAPVDDPQVAEFMDNLERINAEADGADGFVWRLQTDEGNATSIQIFPDPLTLVNMSVWKSVDALRDYVYRSEHVEFFRRRAEWFEHDAKRVALWWVPTGTIPELDEAVRRVEFLERRGPSPYAFGFGRNQTPLVFEQTTPDDPDTVLLIDRLNAELIDLADDPSENHFTLTTDQVTGTNGVMVRARLDDNLIGCGALRRIGPGVGELKRMFVLPDQRGTRIGAAILDVLELHAARLAFNELRLETGPRQPAAIALYEGVGFERCHAWGEYAGGESTSLCYRKMLA